MVRRRQGFTAAQSKTTSRRLRTATLGTHVPRKVRTGSMNAESVGFSSARRQRRAARGFVNNVRPVDGAAPRTPRRMSHREFARGVQRRARVRAVAAVLACLAVVAAVAVGVGVLSLFGTLDGKLALKDSDAASALVPASADDGAFYAVVAANLDANGLTGAALVRVDAASKAVAAVSLPAELQVASADGEARTLRETAASGDAALIGAVASFAGVDVSHYVEVDAQGLADLVDGLGGIEVEVAEEVDDPAAGDVYLPAGTQTLDGASALVLAVAAGWPAPPTSRTAWKRRPRTSARCSRPCRFAFWVATRWAFWPSSTKWAARLGPICRPTTPGSWRTPCAAWTPRR